MTSSKVLSPLNISPTLAWEALVRRSTDAWELLNVGTHRLAKEFLQSYTGLDNFLHSGGRPLMFWFFQRREAFLSQKTMTKWSSDRLDDYVLLPAFNGFVLKTECFFVSHFWHSKDDPDPDGKYLRLLQEELRPQSWSYIWVDWTCAPQDPRTQQEEIYFMRTLQTMSGIIRNSGFAWFYPPFEARMWILYEVAEFLLTSCGPIGLTADIKEFADHVQEMIQVGVRPTLDRHGYRCTDERDREFLTSWLEVLVLLKRLNVDIYSVRGLLDSFVWYPNTIEILWMTLVGRLELRRYDGALTLNGESYAFAPFPKWEDGKYSTETTTGFAAE